MTSRLSIFLISSMCVLAACGQDAVTVKSHVEGQLRVRGDVATTGDYRDFVVTVMNQRDGDVDTLATAVTDSTGFFSMDVHAPAAGVYPLTVERAGQRLSLDELVIVDADSVRISGTYPLGTRPLIIRSPENAAWTAYRNSKAQHNQQMAALLTQGNYTAQQMGQVVSQSATILWSIADTYPNTMGARVSQAESVMMLEGWNDSLVVARYGLIDVDTPNIADVVRAARRATARTSGQDSAIAVVRHYLEVLPDEARRAALHTELVIAYADSGQTEQAVAAATELRRLHPDSEWAEWASRAVYDLENLQPGMPAPAFDLVTRDGVEFSLDDLNGRFVILEFYDPLEQTFQQELDVRDRLFGALQPQLFLPISISVEPDSVLNEGLFDGAEHAGDFVWADGGMDSEVARAYNVHIVPTRYLLDPDGNVVSKYVGRGLANLEQDLVAVVAGLNEIARQKAEN